MKPLKFSCHIEEKYPALNVKPLDFFQKKNILHKEKKLFLKATTSSNMSELRRSFLVANHIAKAIVANRIAKAKKPFTILLVKS